MVSPEEGDRMEQAGGERAVITPASSDNPHNFGPASTRDTTVYTCERPGGDPGDDTVKINTKTSVQEWVEYMTSESRKIKHVIILLEPTELDVYDEPGLLQAYQEAGIIVHHLPIASPKSFATIMNQLDDIHAKGERAVAHCTHGMGRSGRVAAGWLVHKYGLSCEDAVQEGLAAARTAGVERMGAPRQLQAWISESSSSAS